MMSAGESVLRRGQLHGRMRTGPGARAVTCVQCVALIYRLDGMRSIGAVTV